MKNGGKSNKSDEFFLYANRLMKETLAGVGYDMSVPVPIEAFEAAMALIVQSWNDHGRLKR